MISAIAAVDNNLGIGYKGNLLLRIPNDLKRFKKITYGNVVIMGSKTFRSTSCRPFKGRTNIVLTHYTYMYQHYNDAENTSLLMTTSDLINFETIDLRQNVFVIGGSSVYEQLLKYCDRIYLTKIYDEFQADSYFPDFYKSKEWELIEQSDILTYHTEEKDYQYQYLLYQRKKV